MTSYIKRLIEVDLPIKRISEHARREKSIRHGHISTLHIWWARRPLAACRAVLCSAVWLDPADPNCPVGYREVASKQMIKFAEALFPKTSQPGNKLQRYTSKYTLERMLNLLKSKESYFDLNNLDHLQMLRDTLLDFIADFSNWDNITSSVYLDVARTITQAAHEALGGIPGTSPLVFDPFAGGGAIPLEALRIGADAFASDINPVAVLLNKVIVEYIPRYGRQLIDPVRQWGEWIKKQAEIEIAEFYPKDKNGAVPIAYLWARTIVCEGPGCGAPLPLLRSLWLVKTGNRSTALKIVPDTKRKRVTIEILNDADTKEVRPGIVRKGAAICPCCGFTTSADRVKLQLIAQNGGANTARLFAVYVDLNGNRYFRPPSKNDLTVFATAQERADAIRKTNPHAFPDEEINPVRPYKNSRGLSAVTRIGCVTFSDLYNARQLLAIYTFYRAVEHLKAELRSLDNDIAVVVQTLLTLAVSRAVSQNTSVSRWDSTRATIKGAFSKQALAVVWDSAEANLFSGGSADWDSSVEWILEFIEQNSSLTNTGQVIQASATETILPSASVSALFTDPPYFSAIPYGDLSDFFYVWMRRALADVHPELFRYQLTDKSKELIVTNAQTTEDGKPKNEDFFREGMTSALSAAVDAVTPDGIGVVVYAEGTTAGWEAILYAIIAAGWVVTASWPLDTEMENRTRAQDTASLQSSIHIVCRPRHTTITTPNTNIGDWRDILTELPVRIHKWLPQLEREGVVGADAIFSCIGPAMEIYSRYEHVEKASGEIVTLREYLEQVWAAVSHEALSMIFEGADTTGFEADARLTAIWLWTLANGQSVNGNGNGLVEEVYDDVDEEPVSGNGMNSGFALEYDAARKIAQGIGAHLERLDHLIEIKGGRARLLSLSERAVYLFGKDTGKLPAQSRHGMRQMKLFEVLGETEANEWLFDERKYNYPMGKTTLDRLQQAIILHATAQTDSLKQFLLEDENGPNPQFWRLADALLRLYPKSSDENRWLDGLLARKKGLGF